MTLPPIPNPAAVNRDLLVHRYISGDGEWRDVRLYKTAFPLPDMEIWEFSGFKTESGLKLPSSDNLLSNALPQAERKLHPAETYKHPRIGMRVYVRGYGFVVVYFKKVRAGGETLAWVDGEGRVW